MSTLFSGVENFNPAFQARQLAIQSGQGAGQSISRGMQVAQRGQQLGQDAQALDTMTGRLRSRLSSSSGDWAGEVGAPTPWQ